MYVLVSSPSPFVLLNQINYHMKVVLEDYGWGACLRGAPFFKHPGQTARGPFVLGRKQQNNTPKTSKQHAENIKTTRRKHQNNTPKTSKQHAKTSKQHAENIKTTRQNIKTTRQNIKKHQNNTPKHQKQHVMFCENNKTTRQNNANNKT
jgi:hypothetical protein